MRRDADIGGANEGDTATPPDVPGCRWEVGADGERASEGLGTVTSRPWPDRLPDVPGMRVRFCSGVSDAFSEGASHMPRRMGISYRPSTAEGGARRAARRLVDTAV